MKESKRFQRIKELSLKQAYPLVVFAILVFGGAAFFSSFFLRVSQEQNIPRGKILAVAQLADFKDEREVWSRRIYEIGAEEAYEEFKEAYQALNYSKQHALSHVFGTLLFEHLGIEGVAICDSTFAFGCYHSFFGEALINEGLGVLPLFDRACTEKWGDASLPCQHGIGHGILAYIGYGEENLLGAFDLCAMLSWRPTGGCASGVVMEYNFRTMSDLSGSGTLTRSLQPDGDPHEPCISLPEKYQQACYFEQPQWWQSIFGGDYIKIGTLCNQVEDTLSRRACFRGAGNYAALFSGYGAKETITLCEKMPSYRAQFFCREGASWVFLAHPQKYHLAPQLCYGLKGGGEQLCLRGLELNAFAR